MTETGKLSFDGAFGGEDEAPSSRSIQQRLGDHRKLLARLMRLDALTRGDINSAMEQVTELACELLRVERASVWRFDAEKRRIECLDLFERGSYKHSRGAVITEANAHRYFAALSQERCLAAEDAQTDPRTSQFRESYLQPLGIGAMLDAPVFVRGEMVGVVCHEHVGGKRHWEFWEELLAGTIADFMALVSEASDRLRAEQRLGAYRTHVDELRRLRVSEIQQIRESLDRHGRTVVSGQGGVLARDVLDASPVPFLVLALASGLVRYANPRAVALFDASATGLIGHSSAEFYVDPLEREAIASELENSGRIENVVMRLKTQSNWPFWALLSAQRVSFEGEDCAFLGLADITAQKIAEAAVRRSEHSVRALFAAAPVAMCLIGMDDDKLVFGNQRCADLFGLPLSELEGQRSPDYYVNADDRERILKAVRSAGSVEALTLPMRRRNGEHFWALLSARLFEFEGREGILAGITDITPQKALEEKLRELAMQDELTGLYNRRHFTEMAEVELARARRTSAPLSLAMLDIDHFKRVNDVYGHAAGDQVLRELSRAMRETLRGSDVSARIGGEEFVILLSDTALDGAVAVTERLRERIGQTEVALEDGRVVRFTVSAGVTELARGEGLDALLARADEALYRAKSDGRNRTLSSVPPRRTSSAPPPSTSTRGS